MSDGPQVLSESELDVLKTLWELGAGTVRELNAALPRKGRNWAYTTVQTLLARLEAKGCVACDREATAHRFRPTVSRDDLLQQRLIALEQDLCEGAAMPLVHALVAGHRFSAEEIAEFRRILDEHEAQPKPPAGPRKPGVSKPASGKKPS